jgi:hypothetical protein
MYLSDDLTQMPKTSKKKSKGPGSGPQLEFVPHDHKRDGKKSEKSAQLVQQKIPAISSKIKKKADRDDMNRARE